MNIDISKLNDYDKICKGQHYSNPNKQSLTKSSLDITPTLLPVLHVKPEHTELIHIKNIYIKNYTKVIYKRSLA